MNIEIDKLTPCLETVRTGENEFNRLCELDTIAEQAGGFVDFNNSDENEIHYDYRAIIAYCKKIKLSR